MISLWWYGCPIFVGLGITFAAVAFDNAPLAWLSFFIFLNIYDLVLGAVGIRLGSYDHDLFFRVVLFWLYYNVVLCLFIRDRLWW